MGHPGIGGWEKNAGILRCAQNDTYFIGHGGCGRSACELHHFAAPFRSISRVRMPMSLSPRPERLTKRMSDLDILGAILMASATAWADSSAGMMPSVRLRTRTASRASASEAEV